MPERGDARDRLDLSGLSVDCIIGLARAERHKRQPLQVGLTFFFNAQAAAASSDLEQTIDYVRALGDTQFILAASRFILIETAAEALARYLLLANKAASAVEVRLAKPLALGNGVLPTLTLCRRRLEMTSRPSVGAFGRVDFIHASHEAHLYRVSLNPHASVTITTTDNTRIHDGVETRGDADLALGGELKVNGMVLAEGEALSWAPGAARCYENVSDTTQALLIVSPGDTTFATANSKESTLVPLTRERVYPEVLADYLPRCP